MIVQMFFEMIFGVVNFIFGILPNLPPMPSIIQDFGNYLITQISNFSQLAVYIYGSTLFVAIVTLSVALITFDQIWILVKFVAAKIPINIK